MRTNALQNDRYLRAQIEQLADDNFLVSYTLATNNSGGAVISRTPTRHWCSSIDEAKSWAQNQAAAHGTNVMFVWGTVGGLI